MQFSFLGFSVKKVMEFQLDVKDLAILRYFQDFMKSGKMNYEEVDGVKYYWISYKNISDEMPFLGLGKRTIMMRMLRLRDLGLLSHYTKKEGGTFSYYTLGDKFNNLLYNSENRSLSNLENQSKSNRGKLRGEINTKGGQQSGNMNSNNKENYVLDDFNSKESNIEEALEYREDFNEASSKSIQVNFEELIKNREDNFIGNNIYIKEDVDYEQSTFNKVDKFNGKEDKVNRENKIVENTDFIIGQASRCEDSKYITEEELLRENIIIDKNTVNENNKTNNSVNIKGTSITGQESITNLVTTNNTTTTTNNNNFIIEKELTNENHILKEISTNENKDISNGSIIGEIALSKKNISKTEQLSRNEVNNLEDLNQNNKDTIAKDMNRGYSQNDTTKTNLLNNLSTINTNDLKSIKDKIEFILNYLNIKANVNYRTSNKKTSALITARLREGFSVEDFKIVIDKKVSEWRGTDFEQYLNPFTLFGDKFELYLNQKVISKNNNTSGGIAGGNSTLLKGKNNNSDNKKLRFNNFKGREFDYDDIEKKLLGWD